jgi:DNA replication protein DnaC
MDRNDIIQGLKKLKLQGMAAEAEGLLRTPVNMRPCLELSLQKLIEAEARTRDDNRTLRLLKAAKLRYKVNVENIICSVERNLTPEQLGALLDCSFVRNGENLLITGQSGCGKSFIACALGHQACTLGIRTLYLSMNHFVEQLSREATLGRKEEFIQSFEKIDLVIIDDFGLQEMDMQTRMMLLTLLEDRYERKSFIITSQLDIPMWYDYIAEPTIADAIMDRLINTSHHVELKGQSMRKPKK